MFFFVEYITSRVHFHGREDTRLLCRRLLRTRTVRPPTYQVSVARQHRDRRTTDYTRTDRLPRLTETRAEGVSNRVSLDWVVAALRHRHRLFVRVATTSRHVGSPASGAPQPACCRLEAPGVRSCQILRALAHKLFMRKATNSSTVTVPSPSLSSSRRSR